MKPNRWMTSPSLDETRLTYGVQVTPSPLTVSLSQENPTYGSLIVTVTNTTGSTLDVESITFTVMIGLQGDCLAIGSAFSAAVSSPDWDVTLPGSVITGDAKIILGPPSGVSSVALAAGDSVAMEISQIPTSLEPGTSTVQVKEQLTVGTSGTIFQVTTFPYQFYFDNLTATALGDGGSPFPASQVAYGTRVSLQWSTSVTDPNAISVYYSTDQGQQVATPAFATEWVSPPLTCNTVFTVEVSATLFDGDAASATLTVPVSVLPQDVSANSLSVSGPTALLGAVAVGGNVQMLGTPFPIDAVPNQDGFGTDGFIVGAISGNSGNPGAVGWLTAICGEITVNATGGYFYKPGYDTGMLYSSLILPVGKGVPCYVAASGDSVPYSLWFVPIGSSPSEPAAPSRPIAAPERPPAPGISPPPRSELKTLLETLLIDDADERKRRIRAMLDAVSALAKSEPNSG